jgi:hypothetical protein
MEVIESWHHSPWKSSLHWQLEFRKVDDQTLIRLCRTIRYDMGLKFCQSKLNSWMGKFWSAIAFCSPSWEDAYPKNWRANLWMAEQFH